ncbi:MAG: PAS domain S-box protein [Lyngbya sp.]|nr:PAS domain S-box protein [Lyngbya sp.]
MDQLNPIQTLCKITIKKLLPLFIGVLASIAVFFLWEQLTINEQVHIEQLIQQEANAIELQLSQELTSRMQTLERMAKRWQARGGKTQAIWEADARAVLEDFPDYQAIEWVDPSFQVRWVVPQAGNEAAQNLDLTQERRRRITLRVARDLRQIILTRHISLVQGGEGFLATVPLYVDNRFDGFIVGVFRFETLLDNILRAPEGYKVAIYDGTKLIYRQPGFPAQSSLQKTVVVRAYGADWRVEVLPTKAFISETKTSLPSIVLIGGLVLVWLFVLVVHLAQLSQRKIHQVRKVNRQLQSEIHQRQRAEIEKARLAAIVESSEDAIFSKNLDDIITSWNAGAEKIFGYTAREMIGKSGKRLISPDYQQEEQEILQRIQQGERIEHYDTKRLRKEGSLIDVSISVSPIKDETGNIIGASKIARNIAERKQAEVALRQSETRYRQLINNLSAGLVIHAPDTRILLCNLTACELLGLSMEQMMGKTAIDPTWNFIREDRSIMPPEDYPVNRVLATRIPLKNYVVGINQGTENPSWALVNAYPEFEANGEIKQVVTTFINVTKRKQAEEEVQYTRNFLQALLDHLPVAVFVKDAHPENFGVFQFWNKTCEQLFGISAAQAIGKTDYDFFPLEQANFFNQKDREAVEKGSLEKISEEIVDSHSLGKRWLHTMKVPVYNRQDQPDYLLCFSEDITERKQAEIERREMIEVMENALSGISKLDTQGRYLYVNKNYANIAGYQPQEMIGMFWEKTVHPDELEKMVAAYEQMLKEGRVEVETKGIRQDGSIFYKQLVMIACFDEQQQLQGHYCFMKDISERKEAEINLAQELLRTQTLFNTSMDGIVIMNHQGDVVQASTSFAEMLGYTLEETLSLNVADWDAQWTKEELEIMLALEEVIPLFETRHRRKDGSEYDVEISWNRVELNGEMMNFCVCRDISDRKQTEEALRYQKEMFQTIVDNIPVMITLFNPQGQIELINPELERVLGWPLESWQQKDILSKCYPDPVYCQSVLEFMLAATGQWKDMTTLTATGEKIETSWANVRLSNGYCLGIGQDITERKQAEINLQISQARFAGILDIASDAIISINSQQQITLYNKGAEQIFGYTAEEVLGKPLSLLLPERFADLHRQHVSQYAQTESHARPMAERSQIFGRRKDGSEFPAEASISKLNLNNGEVIFTTFLRDISTRQLIENALRESEARFQAFMNNSPTAAWITDANGVMLYASQTYFRTFELPTDDLIGKSLFELYPASLAQQYLDNIQTVAENLQVLKTIEVGPRRDQSLGHFLVYKFPIPDLSGDILIGGVAIDVTQQHQAETALQLSEERLQLALEASGDGLWDWDLTTEQIYFNSYYQEMLGYQPGELIMDLKVWEEMIHPDDKIWVLERLNAHFQDPSVNYNFDYRVRCKSGEWKWIADFGKVVVRDRHGKPLRMIGTHRDITERKQTELVLRQAMEAAEAANLAKSLFLANMSHELRTPLNVILGFAQVMAHDPTLTPTQQQDLQTIQRSGDHLLSLINDVLDLSKIEAGHCTLEETGFDLIALLHSLRNMFAERASSKGLDLCFEIAPEVPQFIVADAQKLRQILINLLSNAIKFTQKGTVTLRVRTQEFIEPNILIFEVEDTGVGISPEELETIFDAFVQAQAGKRSVSGTGLGLTISRKLLEVMGGKIDLRSTIGQGSTFSFTLPVRPTNGVDITPEQSDRQVIALAPGQPHRRILVVDDRRENRLLIVRLLTQLGLEVREASNGQEAVQLWKEWLPDLTWMDIRMPILDGYEATKQIRAMERGQTSIIIALTAQASQSDRTLALAAGCNDYISKPFREQTLFLKMAEYLGLQYIYQEQENAGSGVGKESLTDDFLNPKPDFNPTLLATLPESWLAKLEDAAICGNDLAIAELVEELSPEFAQLGTHLRELANQYQFEQILNLIPGRLSDN